jgi:hypothetical protein
MTPKKPVDVQSRPWASSPLDPTTVLTPIGLPLCREPVFGVSGTGRRGWLVGAVLSRVRASSSPSCSHPPMTQDPDERRDADDRGDHAHRQFARLEGGSRHCVDPEQEHAAQQRGQRQDQSVIRPDEEPYRVRQQQPHEADRSAHRDQHTGEQRARYKQRPANPVDVDAEGRRRVVAKGERVEGAGVLERGQRPVAGARGGLELRALRRRVARVRPLRRHHQWLAANEDRAQYGGDSP